MKVSVRGAWIVCGLSLALITIGAGIGAATWSVSLPPSLVPRGIVVLAAPLISVLGALITIRVPGNAIGYVFLGAGLVGAVQLVSEQVAFAAEAWPILTPLAPWAALAFYALGTANSLGLILYVLALFPRGRLATRAERRAVLIGTVGVLGVFAAASMVSERIPVPFSKYDNPLGHPELRLVAFVIGIVASGAYVLALGSVGFGSVRRFRRSAGIERQQLKWFAYAAALATAGLVPLYSVLSSLL